MKITLDTNCVINLFDRTSTTATSLEELARLFRFAMSGVVEIAITTRVEADLLKDKNPELVEELTAHKTAAMRVELARQPDLALAPVVHSLLQLWYGNPSRASCLGLSVTSPQLRIGQLGAPALQALEQSRETWAARLPAAQEDAWRWSLAKPSG